MLEANNLRTLLEALRPPAGYQLDGAVGTTFSLDLYALITAPLAFAIFDTESAEDDQSSVAELLESLRRYSDRIDIFCQAGQIALPSKYRPIVAYLEAAVHPVMPANRRRVFHPKVWALRYTSDVTSAVYRLLVLSRNLTFDRSWDTLLVLDGAPSLAPEVKARNAPLARFLRHLPRLATEPLARERRLQVEELARDFASIAFELPAGFEELRFWPLGLPRESRNPFAQVAGGGGKRLIISPFLASGWLRQLGPAGVLISRAESLDAIPSSELAGFSEVHVLSDAATADDLAGADDAVTVPEESVAEAAGTTLRGLHAKVFAFDVGSNAHVFTGSANATSAAFAGNVEFLAELVGKRRRCGVDEILDGRGGTGFRSLLEPYDPAAAGETSVDSDLALRVDELRRLIAGHSFDAVAEEPVDSSYRLTLRATGENSIPASASARCWPITLDRAVALPLSRAWGEGVEFVVSPEGLTAFFAVELILREGRQTERVDFVIRAVLEGAPADRLDRLLVQLLRTRGDVLRYMLFLLAGDDAAIATIRGFTEDSSTRSRSGDGQPGAIDLPLVEWMVRALARTPERVDHLARLIASLRATDEGRELLPQDLDEIWDVIWAARTASRS